MAINHYANIYKATYFSLLFLIIFCPINVVSNLLNNVTQESGAGQLGAVMLAIQNLLQGVFAITATSVILRFGVKGTVFSGAFLLSLFTAVMIYFSWVAQMPAEDKTGLYSNMFVYILCIIASILSGIGSAYLWVG
jgi:hypothetical protein